jgi:tight adherence protein C
VKDPMAKRVKALNARRDELKSGIIKQSGRKRQSLVRRTDATDKVKDTLENMKVLQESQVKIIQQKLAQAGYRNKELAVFVIFARMVLPIVLGFVGVIALYWVEMFPEWGSFKRSWVSRPWWSPATKGPSCSSRTRPRSAPTRSARGCPTRSTCSSSAPRPASPSMPRSTASPRNWAAPIPSSATSSR